MVNYFQRATFKVEDGHFCALYEVNKNRHVVQCENKIIDVGVNRTLAEKVLTTLLNELTNKEIKK